jgi:hypothetical protein
MNSNNKNTRMNSEQQLKKGAQKHLKQPVVIDGEKYPLPEIVAVLEARMQATAEVVAARAEWEAKVRAERQKLAETKRFVSGLRQTVLIMFATSNHILADFGLSARRPRRELTAVEKVERVARALSTRAARHTMGPRAKEKIKGDGDVNVTVTTGSPKPIGPPLIASGGGAEPAPMLPPTTPSASPVNGASGANGAVGSA